MPRDTGPRWLAPVNRGMSRQSRRSDVRRAKARDDARPLACSGLGPFRGSESGVRCKLHSYSHVRHHGGDERRTNHFFCAGAMLLELSRVVPVHARPMSTLMKAASLYWSRHAKSEAGRLRYRCRRTFRPSLRPLCSTTRAIASRQITLALCDSSTRRPMSYRLALLLCPRPIRRRRASAPKRLANLTLKAMNKSEECSVVAVVISYLMR